MADRLTIGDLLYRLGLENEQELVTRLGGTFEKGEAAAGQSGARAGRTFSDQFKGAFGGAAIGAFLGTQFATFFNRAAASAQRFFSESIQAATDFETRLANINSLGANTEAQMEELRRGVLELGPAVGEGPSALTEALYDVVSAGFDGRDALDVLEASTRAARAGLTDTKTAADAVTTALNAYGLEGRDATRITDALQVTVQRGKTNWDELGGSIGRVIPIAATAGVGIEELGAATAALTAQGIGTAEAVTGIRQTLVAMLNPTTQAKRLASELGIEFDTQALRAKGLEGVLQDVLEATGGNEQQMATLFGRVESLNAVLALTSDQGGRRFNEAQKAMRDAAGATDEAFQTQMDTTEAAERRFQAAMETIKISIGEQFTPGITEAKNMFADFVLGFLNGTQDLDEQANRDLASVGAGFRWLAETIWDRLNSAARAGSEFVTWFEFAARGIEITADNSAQRIGGFLGRMVNVVAQSVSDAWEHVTNFFSWFDDETARRDALREAGMFSAPGSGGSGGRAGTTPTGSRTPPPPVPEVPDIETGEPPPAPSGGGGGGAGGGVARATGGAAGRQIDPLVDEARRIRDHVRFLDAMRDTDRMNAEEYEQWLEAHLRRLGGMWDRAITQEQQTAILEAERNLMRDLGRLRDQLEVEEQAALDRRIAQYAEYTQSRIEAAEAAAEEEARRAAEAAETELERRRADVRRRLVELGMADVLATLGDAFDPAAVEGLIRTHTSLTAVTEDGARAARERAAAEREVRLELERFEAATKRFTAAQERLAEAESRRAREMEAAALRQRAIRAGLAEMVPEIHAEANLDALARVIALTEEHNRLGEEGLEQDKSRLEAEREMAQARRELAEELRNRTLESLRAAGDATSDYVSVMHIARGEITRLRRAQLELGEASEIDLLRALEQQEAMLRRIISRVEEGSERYFELIGILQRVRTELERMDRPGLGFVFGGPTPPAGDTGTDDELEGGLNELEQRFAGIAMDFPTRLIEGIQRGDVGGALMATLDDASNFFIDQMLEGIGGPIAENLSQSVAGALGGGPLGIALGIGGALFGIVGSLIGGRPGRAVERGEPTESRRGGSAPSITNNYTANLTVTLEGGLRDPSIRAELRGLVEQIVLDLDRRRGRANE